MGSATDLSSAWMHCICPAPTLHPQRTSPFPRTEVRRLIDLEPFDGLAHAPTRKREYRVALELHVTLHPTLC